MTKKLIVFVSCLLSMGCATTSATDADKGKGSYSVYSWTSLKCPSDTSGQNEFAFLTIFGDLLIGTLIDTGLNMMGTALNEAAERDKNGWARTGKSPAYLYGVVTDKGKQEVVPAACMIVAYAKAPTPGKWCDGLNDHDAKRIEELDTACSVGRTVLDSLNGDRHDRADTRAKKLDRHSHAKEPPLFYAEIKLVPSTDSRALRPELFKLYYPVPFQKRRGEYRNLVLSADAKGLDGKSLAMIVMTLKNIVPGEKIADDVYLTAEIMWVALPAYNPSEPKPSVDLIKLNNRRVGPVNLVTEIRETGDINSFLQAFAAAFKANTEDASKALKSELTTSGRTASAEADDKAEADLESLNAAALKAGVDVLNACAKKDTGGEGEFASPVIKQATIMQLQSAEKAAKLAANATARKAELAERFASVVSTSCP